MPIEEEVDIYGDYDFGSDDILDEIVIDKPPVIHKKRPAPEDDKPAKDDKKVLKVPRIEEKQAPQKIQTTTQHNNSSYNSDTRSMPASMTQLRGISSKPTNCIYLGELHWYTTDKKVRELLVKAKLIDHLKEMTFFEHKLNGKSRGIVFFEFANSDYASEAKSVFEKTELDHKKMFTVYTTSPNPFKNLSKESNGLNKQRNYNNNSMPRTNNNTGVGSPMMSTNAFPMAAFAGAFNPYAFTNPQAAMSYGNGGGPMRTNRSNSPQQHNYQQPYRGNNQSRNNNNMNDGAGLGGMYINPAFFDPTGGNGGNNGGRSYRNQ